MKKILIGLLMWSLVISTSAQVGGVDHVGLSVLDLKASEKFFVKYGGFKVFNRDDSYPASFLNNGSVIITLWRVQSPETAVKFDRKNNIGLHHVALSVDSFEALDQLYEKLRNDKDVVVEFAPELLGKGPTEHMIVYEPSGNRVEFIHRSKK